MNHKHYSIFTTNNTSYVLWDIFMQFVAVRAKIWWNNKESSFSWNTVCIWRSLLHLPFVAI